MFTVHLPPLENLCFDDFLFSHAENLKSFVCLNLLLFQSFCFLFPFVSVLFFSSQVLIIYGFSSGFPNIKYKPFFHHHFESKFPCKPLHRHRGNHRRLHRQREPFISSRGRLLLFFFHFSFDTQSLRKPKAP